MTLKQREFEWIIDFLFHTNPRHLRPRYLKNWNNGTFSFLCKTFFETKMCCMRWIWNEDIEFLNIQEYIVIKVFWVQVGCQGQKTWYFSLIRLIKEEKSRIEAFPIGWNTSYCNGWCLAIIEMTWPSNISNTKKSHRNVKSTAEQPTNQFNVTF